MSPLDKLERKWRWLAKPNLMLVFVICYAVGYVLYRIFPAAMNILCFNPPAILQGQVWRLFTFLIYPNTSSLFLAMITCFIYFSIARSLETVIGRFKVNFFLLLGVILLDVFGFVFYFIMPMQHKIYAIQLNPYYLYAMLFVMFALMFPDARFLFMFIIPIRGKWMVFITFALYLLDVVEAFSSGFYGSAWIMVFMILAAVLDIVFFLLLTNYSGRKSRAFRKTQKAFKTMYASGTQTGAQNVRQPRHRCAICGRTDISNPELDFRYCSKCAGNYEYCSEHLYTHVHVTDPLKNPEN